jgi:hypothetical protein
LGDLVKDTTELDLWAFDDLDPTVEETPKPPPPPVSSAIPMPRERKKIVPLYADDTPPPTKPLKGKHSVRVDVSKDPLKTPSGSTADRSLPGDDFDDLDDLNQWDDAEPPALSIHPSLINPPVVEPTAAEEPETEESTPPVEEPDEFSPTAPENAKPMSLVPRLGLSKLELFGLCSLCAILLLGGGVVFFNSIHRLPAGDDRLKAGDFPVEGRHLVILSADTYWRPPISEGKNADTYRRGTQLLPVVELTSSGSPAAVRVFFRDQDGLVTGDAVTRAIKPGVPLQIAATAGFEDVGMHAAYRTGQGKPWTIEVLEAPSVTSPNAEFRKLFEINISTDRR